MLGTGSLVQQLQDIDRSAALPANTAFSTLWGCYMTGEASQFQVGVAESEGGALQIVTPPVLQLAAAAVQRLPSAAP